MLVQSLRRFPLYSASLALLLITGCSFSTVETKTETTVTKTETTATKTETTATKTTTAASEAKPAKDDVPDRIKNPKIVGEKDPNYRGLTNPGSMLKEYEGNRPLFEKELRGRTYDIYGTVHSVEVTGDTITIYFADEDTKEKNAAFPCVLDPEFFKVMREFKETIDPGQFIMLRGVLTADPTAKTLGLKPCKVKRV